ncbi:hypothetical protein BCR44DRAFT_31217 [Catenaria anguillulae PL171]|uniref:Uncharacterized protein n=1 Tax=Catenaria anguillulae PL171 TaxID=765915 RepID=A0A1Y2I5Z5_9FUNG|nr:hypothetical protein BCR44DRAFT_31217 [Catenaria anguillulae PL171]
MRLLIERDFKSCQNTADLVQILPDLNKFRDNQFDDDGSHVFRSWSIYDAIVNCVISIAFITFLQRLAGNGSGLRKGFSEMLSRITWLLGIECTLMISANLLVQIAPTLDPAWMSIYVCESLRLRIFCMFLQTLNRMLRQKVVTELPSSASRDQFLTSATNQHHDRGYAAIAMPESAAGGFSSSSRLTTWQGDSRGTSSSHLDVDGLPL